MFNTTKTKQKAKAKARSVGRGPGRRGWSVRGGGHAGVVIPPPEWRGTSVQVCGLWPFADGVGNPLVGVPLGHDLHSHATVCADPVSWFAKAGLISNPSMLITGKPGLGKSTTVRRMATGLAGYGVTPLVFGDLKPDYVDLIKALGGNVVQLGRGRGSLNVLDPGASGAVANRLVGTARTRLIADVKGRRLTLLGGLISLNRGDKVTDHEEAILTRALTIVDEHHQPGHATLADLIKVIDSGPSSIRQVTSAHHDDTRYRQAVDPITKSLNALDAGGLGDVFGQRTTTQIDLSKPLCIDISGIAESDEKLQAGVLLACWAEGFGSVAAMQALTDAGLAEQQNFLIILDELWRVMRAGAGMIDRLDALTRLDRATGVGTMMVTHTLKDFLSVSADDRTKAQSFAERMGMFGICGVPASEIKEIRNMLSLSDAEASLLTSWASPDAWDPKTGRRQDPPGLGKILLKAGGRPGIPVKVQLTEAERAVNDTNQKWNT